MRPGRKPVSYTSPYPKLPRRARFILWVRKRLGLPLRPGDPGYCPPISAAWGNRYLVDNLIRFDAEMRGLSREFTGRFLPPGESR